MASPASPAMNQAMIHEKPVRDDLYYLESVVFLVEDNLFKTSRQYFEKNSDIFSNIVGLPPGGKDAIVGSSDENPICLIGVKKVDFERLLGVIYSLYWPVITGRSEWESALKLSRVWGMDGIRDVALGKLKKYCLDSVDEILLGQTYGAPNWLLAGCKKLVQRKDTISVPEGRRLGPDTLARICQMREAYIRGRPGTKLAQRGDKYHSIRVLFFEELADADSAHSKMVGNTHFRSSCIDNDPSVPEKLQPVRNERFYMDSIVFLVGDNLFKVPQACFEHTGIFCTIFSLPRVDGFPVDGSDDEHPFKLDGIDTVDFRAFLKVLYPLDIPLQTTTISKNEWEAVLKLSTMWDFFQVRKLAIEELSKVVMNPITKILLAKKYSISKWLFAGYEELVKRTESISVGEAEQLGWETAILIFQIREESLAKFQTVRIKISTVKGEDDQRETVHDVEGPFDRKYCDGAEGIQKAFAKELKDAEEQEPVDKVDTGLRALD